MTPLHADIIRTIEKHGPITSEDIAERLTGLGYGGGTCFDEFKRQVSKIASKLKASGKVIGDDIPQPKTKPMRVYRMANPQSDCQSAEMAIDVAEVEQSPTSSTPVDFLTASGDFLRQKATYKESLTVADADMVATLDALDTEREFQERQAVAETPENFTDTWSTTLTTHFKASHKPHLAIADIMDAYHQEVAEDTDQNFYSFCLGVAFAEKHHGIGQ